LTPDSGREHTDEQFRQLMADIDAILAQKALGAIASILEQHGAVISRPFPEEAIEEMKRALNGYASEGSGDGQSSVED
jgi:hypothetical protein